MVERLKLVQLGPHPDKELDGEYKHLVSRMTGVVERMCEIHAREVPDSELRKGYYENDRAKMADKRKILRLAVINKLMGEGQMG